MSVLKLYELADSYSALLQMLEEMSDDDLQLALVEVKGELTEKAASIGKMVKSIDYDIDTLKAEEKRLSDRRKALENKKERVKDYLFGQMEKAQLDKIKTPLITLTIQNNPPAVELEPGTMLPAKYLTIIPESYQVNKKAIAEALKAGEEVAGARLTHGKSLRIK